MVCCDRGLRVYAVVGGSAMVQVPSSRRGLVVIVGSNDSHVNPLYQQQYNRG